MAGYVESFGEAILGALDSLFSPIAEALGKILTAIADFTVWVPHPEWRSASQIMSAPDSGIWLSIWETHWEVMVPVSMTILITAWFGRQFGVATSILGAEQGARSKRNLIIGMAVIMLSWWIAGAYLNFVHLIVSAVTPDPGAMQAAIPDLGISTVGVAVAVYYLELSIGATIFVLLILINIVRVIAVYAFVILFPVLMAVYYADLPVLSSTFQEFNQKLAGTALWTFPVAAGWRVMVVLADSNEGVLAAITGASGVGVDAIDGIMMPFIVMIPGIIGIASPLLMSNVSQMYYLSNMADISVGGDSGSASGGGPGPGGNVNGNGSSGGSTGGTGSGGEGFTQTAHEPDTVGSLARGDQPVGEAPQGERDTAVRSAAQSTKEHFDFLDEDSNMVDWENVDKTKDRAKTFGRMAGRAKDGAQKLGSAMTEPPEGMGSWKELFIEGEGSASGAGVSDGSGGGGGQGSPSGGGAGVDSDVGSGWPPNDGGAGVDSDVGGDWPPNDGGASTDGSATGEDSSGSSGGSGNPVADDPYMTDEDANPSLSSSGPRSNTADNLQDLFGSSEDRGETSTSSSPPSGPDSSNTEDTSSELDGLADSVQGATQDSDPFAEDTRVYER